MRDTGGNRGHDVGHAGYLGLALEVIERLARRHCGVAELQQDVLDRLIGLTISPGPAAAGEILGCLREARILPEQALTDYIPAIARALGRGWEEDEFSFAQVTIGSARLQGLLHHIQGDMRADSMAVGGSKAVLVVVPPGEQHTLGAMVLAALLRRRGISVSIQIAPALSDLSRLLATRQFDAALVSIASTEKVEIAAKTVKSLKNMSKGRLLVAAGGPGCVQMADALVSSGVDLITDDIDVVVANFGLQEPAAVVKLARG